VFHAARSGAAICLLMGWEELMRLSRKTWVMMVLSIIWIVGAGVYTREGDVDRAQSFAKRAYKVCTDGKILHHETDLSSCDVERSMPYGATGD
jgi:hypothetical protein